MTRSPWMNLSGLALLFGLCLVGVSVLQSIDQLPEWLISLWIIVFALAGSGMLARTHMGGMSLGDPAARIAIVAVLGFIGGLVTQSMIPAYIGLVLLLIAVVVAYMQSTDRRRA